LATEKLNDMAIKGTIHEFGRAPGLPHISPRPEVDLGNSLMGPVNRDYWSRSGSDDVRVYLTQASAFALWKHPIFRKQRTPNPSYPKEVKFENLQFKEADDGKNILVTGSLKSSDPAHSVIAYDSERGQFGDYWARTYVAPIDEKTGAFAVTVTSPHKSGSLFLSFNLESEINTSDGQKPFQRGSSISARYAVPSGERKFERTSE
jgi:hypothetical protein